MESDKLHKVGLVVGERIWRHHRKLCTEIGHRILGTENDRLAAKYIESHFLNCGLVTDSQYFDCPTWDHLGTTITTNSGYKISPPEGGACMFSLPCNISGEIINLRTIEELEKTDIKGKICVISEDLRNAPLRTDRNPLLLLLEKKQPLAIIIIDTIEHGYLTKIIRDPVFKIPVCAVSANSGRKILSDGGMVEININSKRYKSSSRNIIASNTKENIKKIKIIAHYDTSDTQGAVDNGSGTAVMLEIAEVIKEINRDIPIEFIAFGGEEYARVGSIEYEKTFSHVINNTCFVINIDAVAGCNCEARMYIASENEELNHALQANSKLIGNYHKLIFDQMPMISDHDIYYKKNIPTVLISHYGADDPCDTSLDIPRVISLGRLENVAKIIIGTILDMTSFD